MAKWAFEQPQPMATAPKDGTRVLAWWPPFNEAGDNGGWVTTWWETNAGGLTGWESPWEYADLDSPPTHWLPHPDAPKGAG